MRSSRSEATTCGRDAKGRVKEGYEWIVAPRVIVKQTERFIDNFCLLFNTLTTPFGRCSSQEELSVGLLQSQTDVEYRLQPRRNLHYIS